MAKIRANVPENYKWDLTDIFKTEQDFISECESVTADTKTLAAYSGKLTDGDTVLAFLKAQDEVVKRLEKAYCYAMMKRDEDGGNSNALSLMSKAVSANVAVNAATAFFTPELLTLSEETLNGFIVDPRFSDYDYMLKGLLRQKAHVLSEGEEKLLAMGGEIYGEFRNIFSMIDNVDFKSPQISDGKGGKIALTSGAYSMCLASDDKALRKRAFKAYYKEYINNINTIAAVYAANVKKDVYLARARKYESCLADAMAGEDVDVSVYYNLLKCVNKNCKLMHRYIAARKKLLPGSLHMYDLYVPIVENAELKLSYEEAFDLVKEGLAPLGKDYIATLQKAHDERWIDVEETQGKRSGAYACGVYGVHPYVLLNYAETTHDVFTIAHELGHAMHSYLSADAQPYAKADYRIFVAEVASTVNEVLLLKHVLAKAEDKKLKKYLLSYYMDMIRTTLFRQTMFAEFEAFTHETVEKGGALTKDVMNEYYLSLNKKYYGRSVISDEEIAYEWCRIPHFYTSFYVYKYATGIISAISIAERILKEGEPAVQDYFKFLSSGGSDAPVELLKLAGVDLSQKEPFEAAMQSFKAALTEFLSIE